MLSKSRFLAGLQCPLRLWHQVNTPQLAAEGSPARSLCMKYENFGITLGELSTGNTGNRGDGRNHLILTHQK